MKSSATHLLDGLDAVLTDLELDAADVSSPGADGGGAGTRHLFVEAPAGSGPAALPELVATCERELSEDGALLLFLAGAPSDADLAAWRNALWPLMHVFALYRSGSGGLAREILQGRTRLEGRLARDGVLLAARRRTHTMSPEATVLKFDQNASGWNGDPGGPGYPHFRWMRRLVGLYGTTVAGGRILDFGCGAGWVGIEAALATGAATLHGFDPSPEMCRIAAENAQREGLKDVEYEPGFGEEPPFPPAGEERYDLVVSSGVISFSPDTERFIEGLVGTVKPGATLVIGDINRRSRGFRARRGRRPLLPGREMNAFAREDVRALLEQRGFRHERSGAYQLTFPMPQLMHVNETRLGGLLTYPLLWSNRLATACDGALRSPWVAPFDSWVMRFRAPAG